MLSTFTELPGSSFGRMAAARESQLRQQFAVRNSSYIDHMATPHLDLSLPHFPSYQWPTANAAFPGQYAPDLSAFGGFRPPQCNIPCPTGEPYPKGSQCALPRGLGVVDKQPVGAPQRRFLIFDQSENHTRLFLGPSFSPLDKMFASKTPVPLDKAAAHVDPRISANPAFEEKWDENHLSEEEGETYEEDSDDIDALLYSDTDSDDDDEVTSTEHSPPLSLDELTEEITSPAPKRRKLLDDKHEKSSLESHDDDDMESRCAGDEDSGKKVKIREALKMLESIIPGLDGSDPVSIIDGAVAYLKAMKSSLGGA